MVDRLVPVQRAYNAVRNRKHEYFKRFPKHSLLPGSAGF